MESAGLINDSLKLAYQILDNILPNEKWGLINIAQNSEVEYINDDFNQLPTQLKYDFDLTPSFIQKEGVVEEKIPYKWYSGIYIKAKGETTEDPINNRAREVKYITEKQIIRYYGDPLDQYRHIPRLANNLPRVKGQFTILVNRQKLTNFINYYSNLGPRFDEETGELQFLGEVVQFKGEVEIKDVALLVNNLNSIVSKKDFYQVRVNSDYDKDVDRHSKTSVNDMSEKVFDTIKSKIKNNPTLKNALVIVQQDGFGMFVNQKVIISKNY